MVTDAIVSSLHSCTIISQSMGLCYNKRGDYGAPFVSLHFGNHSHPDLDGDIPCSDKSGGHFVFSAVILWRKHCFGAGSPVSALLHFLPQSAATVRLVPKQTQPTTIQAGYRSALPECSHMLFRRHLHVLSPLIRSGQKAGEIR